MQTSRARVCTYVVVDEKEQASLDDIVKHGLLIASHFCAHWSTPYAFLERCWGAMTRMRKTCGSDANVHAMGMLLGTGQHYGAVGSCPVSHMCVVWGCDELIVGGQQFMHRSLIASFAGSYGLTRHV